MFCSHFVQQLTAYWGKIIPDCAANAHLTASNLTANAHLCSMPFCAANAILTASKCHFVQQMPFCVQCHFVFNTRFRMILGHRHKIVQLPVVQLKASTRFHILKCQLFN
ncbi:hypothetical protein U1Q18_018126 [Sarracenia purpurea var. burkii]